MNYELQPKASHFIDGDYVEDKTGREIPVYFPATGERIATLFGATDAIIEKAILAAERAQKEWASWSPVERGRVLRRVADIIRERNQPLSLLETYDTGKPLQETLVADATSGADAFEFFGSQSQTINGEMIPLGEDFVYTIREPLGICLGIGAWNYPTQIASWKGAPALVCGNAMIFKPSETTPLSALKIAEIIHEAGAPKGLYNVVQGYGDVGAKLVSHPKIAKVSLTGSVETGKKVYSEAAKGVRQVTMELGGKSPLIIFDDADIENAISGIMLANFYSTGQVCSNGTRVFVQNSMKDKLLNRLVERTKAIKIGDPRDIETQMGSLVSKEQLEKVMSFVEIGKNEGATLVIGGARVTIPEMPEGYFMTPAVFDNVSDEMRIAREEIFGPVISLLGFDSEDEVIARANDTELGLSAGVFTQDITRAHRVIRRINAGSCWINTYNLAPVEAPFGGNKLSGVGRENSRLAIEYYSQVKSVYVAMTPVESAY